MYSFYIVRGHTLEELEKLSLLERLFYIHAMGEYYNDEARKWGATDEDIENAELEAQAKIKKNR